MQTIPLYGDGRVNSLEELQKRVSSISDSYAGVLLKGAIFHTNVIYDNHQQFFNNSQWANFVTTATFEREARKETFETYVEKENVVIYRSFLSVESFSELLQELGDDKKFTISDYEVRLREPDYEKKWSVPHKLRTSHYNRYDHYNRHFTAHAYDIRGRFGDIRTGGLEITQSSAPGGFGLEQNDPPFLNVFDAIEEYMEVDSRSGNRGRFFVFQPYYDYRIRDCSLNSSEEQVKANIDKYKGKINKSDGLTLQLISSVGESQGEVRKSVKVTSAHESMNIPKTPDGLYVLLSNDEEVIDIRRLSSGTRATPLLEKALDLKNSDPFVAGATARMALLETLRRWCDEKAIQYKEEIHEVPELANKLQNHNVISGHERGQIEESWYSILSRATHLRKSEVSPEELQRTIDDVDRFLSEKDIE